MKLTLALALAATTACLSACASGSGGDAKVPLRATEWTLDSMGGKSVPSDSGITLTLGTDGNAAGNAGVNRYFGRYNLDEAGGTLSFLGMGSTRMAGPADRMNRESEYLSALAGTAMFRRKGEKLELIGEKTLVFQP